jgi:hypothetical protein
MIPAALIVTDVTGATLNFVATGMSLVVKMIRVF